MKKYCQALLCLLLLLLAPFCAVPASAQDNSGKADYRMAINYYSGENGYQKDLSKAVEYFQKAEQKGCYDGDLFYGHCLAYGNGVTKNVDEGARRIARAASTGDAQALYFYAVCIEGGVGVKRNAATAMAYFAEAAKKGNQSAINALRDSYGITDYSSYSIDWHNSERFLANNNTLSDGKADYRMAMNYYSGQNGYQKDYFKAVEYFKKAEQKGCYDGDLFYGHCIAYGNGVTKDADEGAKRLARAASTGDAQSLFYYGICFEEGIGVSRDISTAKAYFAEAGKKNFQNAIKKLRDSYGITDYSSYSIDWHNSERFLAKNKMLSDGKADYRMAMNYYSGSNGYQKNYFKAVEYFKKAEQKGCYDGDLFYGHCIAYGNGVTKDADEGAKRLARAASTGDAQSLFYYGICFVEGVGVSKNISTAKAYFAEAAKKGQEKAIKRLRDSYGITDYSSYSIDWHNSERFLVSNGGNNQNVATTIDWLTYTPAVTSDIFNLRAGVKSPSKITGWRVLINGIATRGINAVANDGYSLMINKNISLSPGVNHVVIEVTNASGTTVSTKDITYKANNVTANLSRIALVIGNSAYNDPSYSLRNPVHDADDVAAKLSSLGFKVLKFTDQGQAAIEKAIADFGRMARGYDVALFYYAGHGMSSRGSNYIIPVDAVLPSEDAVRYKCVDVNIVLDMMEAAGCPMKILVLDACRNNPFTRSWYRSLGTRGLSNMSAPNGTFISFATAPGEVAVDGIANERNSPYTALSLRRWISPVFLL